MSEEQDLMNNGILPNTVSRWIYNEYRKAKVSHKEAVMKTVDAIKNMQSTSMDTGILKALKDAFFNTPGTWS